MDAKHTPGPWVHFPEDNLIFTEDGLRLLQWQSRSLDIPVDERDANARLVAASPDLLEACLTFSEWLRREEAGFPADTRFNTPDGEAKWREWYDENLRICDLAQTQALAAIAKATGAAR